MTESKFDPNKYMTDIKGKPYLPVAARIAWMRTEHPDWGITTKAINRAEKAVVIKATIKDENGNILATARKKEIESNFHDYMEKAETGAIGRALVFCGYGTLQAPEIDDGVKEGDQFKYGNGPCPDCSAPFGKPHATGCPNGMTEPM